jgi:hypothetical protein
MSQRHLLLCSGLLKYISMVMNMHSTVEELFGTGFSNHSKLKLCGKSQRDPGSRTE